MFLTDAWKGTNTSLPDKVSFCFTDENLFTKFCQMMEKAKLNNMFSAILIDTSVPAVVKETSFDSPFHKHTILDLWRMRQEKPKEEPVEKWTPEPEYIMVHEKKEGGK